MPAETNLTNAAAMKKVREIDFIQQFTHDSLNKLIEILGVTRKIPMQEGTTMYMYTMSGTLESGAVTEGEVIPLTKITQTKTAVGEITLNKWRKAVSAEAIMKSGSNVAIAETDTKLRKLVQAGVRSNLFTFLNGTITGATSVTGADLQDALAAAWGQLQVKFEDDDIQAVFIMNPLDIADYLKTAQISTQTAFGFTYVENFLGLGTVILTAQVTKGKFYATASQNIVAYYIDARGADGLGEAFDFTTDPETGFVGVHEEGNYERLQSETVAIAGVDIFAEVVDGIIVGTITPASEGGEGGGV